MYSYQAKGILLIKALPKFFFFFFFIRVAREGVLSLCMLVSMHQRVAEIRLHFLFCGSAVECDPRTGNGNMF